jgi:hypothetical protein
LFGGQNQHDGNKTTGVPVDKDGNYLLKEDGSPDTEAQPPFLLRWSPGKTAKELPNLFEYDSTTNKLSLKDGQDCPWIRAIQGSRTKKSSQQSWLYCNECQHSLRPESQKQSQTRIPFRDSASQQRQKPLRALPRDQEDSPEARNQSQTDMFDMEGRMVLEAEGLSPPSLASAEPLAPLSTPVNASYEEADDDVDDGDSLSFSAPELPTIDQYRVQWSDGLAWHSRTVHGDFSISNLVPKPHPELWQDVPYVPFDKLKSREAQQRLSVCRSHCELQPPKLIDFRPRFAHLQGDVRWKQRGPLQLAGTVGFLLSKNDGRFMKITGPGELQAVHECLNYQKHSGKNVLLQGSMTVIEKLLTLTEPIHKLLRENGILPEGDTEARIHISKKHTGRPAEATLEDSLNDLTEGLQ